MQKKRAVEQDLGGPGRAMGLRAMRVVSRESTRNGKLAVVTGSTSLDRYPLEGDGKGHSEALATVLALFERHIRDVIGRAMELCDAESAALFTAFLYAIDTWLVEAHLHVTS